MQIFMRKTIIFIIIALFRVKNFVIQIFFTNFACFIVHKSINIRKTDNSNTSYDRLHKR